MKRRDPRRNAWLALLAACAACGVEPAPEDLDGVLRWMFRNARRAPDAQVADAFARLDGALDGSGLAEPLQARVGPLAEEDAAAVEPAARGDLARAAGMLVADVVRCPLARVEELSIALDQKRIFGGYERYTRAYTSDAEAYRGRRTPFLAWTTGYTVSALGISYDATVLGESRFVPPEGPRGAVIVQRAWLAAPAAFDNPDDFFRQDYQLHALYERVPGEVVKVTALWRDMRFAGFDTGGDVLAEFTLSGIVRANRKLEEHCSR